MRSLSIFTRVKCNSSDKWHSDAGDGEARGNSGQVGAGEIANGNQYNTSAHLPLQYLKVLSHGTAQGTCSAALAAREVEAVRSVLAW